MQKRKQFYFPVFLHPNHDPFHLNRSGPDFYAMNIGTFLRWESKMGAFYKIAIGIIVGNFWPVIDADQSVWCVCNDLLSNECRCISRWTIVRNTWPKLVYLNIVIKNSCRAKKRKNTKFASKRHWRQVRAVGRICSQKNPSESNIKRSFNRCFDGELLLIVAFRSIRRFGSPFCRTLVVTVRLSRSE